MNDDMSQFLGVFLDEANEQMELLEKDILQLEQAPSQDLLQRIFRAAHTLKGSSRAMGFTPMGELTHAMEDVFDKLRQDELTVNVALIDALFVGLDALKVMKEEIAATGATTLDTTTQTARLRAALDGAAPAAPKVEAKSPILAPPAASANAAPAAPEDSPAAVETSLAAAGFHLELALEQQNALEAALETGLKIFGIRVTVSDDCIMKSVRALMTLQTLERVGSLLATWPNDEALDNEQFEQDFEVTLATAQDMETIRATINKVTEIRVALIAPWPTEQGTEDREKEEVREKGKGNGERVGDWKREKDAEEAESAEVIQNSEERRTGPEDRRQQVEEKKAAPAQAPTVRVDVARLDKLLNLVGELVIDRTRIAQLGTQFEQVFKTSDLTENLNETAAHIGRITDELQEEIMKARMLPIDNVFSRFPRMVRDLSQKLGKEVNFVVEGKETELDRSVIEVIGDPLIHMLRNSVDHGVEMPADRITAGKAAAGTVWLRARHEENHIVIEIEDDGGGIDPEKLRANAVKKGVLTPEAASRMTDLEAINLIFDSGFSTAKIVSDVSGRGVGMDIVKSNLEKLGAKIDIESKVGKGSRFTVKLPLTLAIIRGLLVNVRNGVYALPLSSVVETLKINRDEIHVINHREVVLQRGRALPIARLRDIFPVNLPAAPLNLPAASTTAPSEGGAEKSASFASLAEARARKKSESLYLVIVGAAEKQIGLVVDSLIGEQEVVIKTLGKFIGEIKGISGATILGDGRVALIADINGLAQCAAAQTAPLPGRSEEELDYAA